MTKLTILLALLTASATACVDQTDDRSATGDDTILAHQPTSLAQASGDNCGEDDGSDGADDGSVGRPSQPDTAALAPEQCEMLPADGPCSLACSPELLVETYVPAGTCMIVPCVLADGEKFNTGGCKPAE